MTSGIPGFVACWAMFTLHSVCPLSGSTKHNPPNISTWLYNENLPSEGTNRRTTFIHVFIVYSAVLVVYCTHERRHCVCVASRPRAYCSTSDQCRLVYISTHVFYFCEFVCENRFVSVVLIVICEHHHAS